MDRTVTGGSPRVAVDIGNTSLKVGLLAATAETSYAALAPCSTLRLPTHEGNWAELGPFLPAAPALWLVASVNRSGTQRLQNFLAQHRPHDRLRQLSGSEVPLPLEVDVPEQVGLDRVLAAFAAAKFKSPGHAAVVVNSGTAITVDLVAANGTFQGGAILPGPQLMARALHERTDRLPLVDVSEPPNLPFPGRNTMAALQFGIQFGVQGAVRELVERLERQAGAPTEVFLAAANLNHCTFLSPRRDTPLLVLAGLHLAWRQLPGETSHA